MFLIIAYLAWARIANVFQIKAFTGFYSLLLFGVGAGVPRF
jgi:hypothetical protein